MSRLATTTATAAPPTIGIAVALALALACGPLSAAECPAPASATKAKTPAKKRPAKPPAAEAEQPIEVEADSIDGTRDGEMMLNGEVLIKQGERQLKTRDAIYDQRDQSFQVNEGVEYSDPDLRVKGASAHLDRDGGATFETAQFEMPDRSARGSASRIRATSQGLLQLDKVRYTTCPLGNEDWMLTASDIDISQAAGIGIGRGVRLDFKGVPILYTPIISFPVGNERKSGFLFPTIGTSSRSGSSVSLPWYWNIAPNYDATLTPTWFTKRGGKLDTELRYLNDSGSGQLDVEYLPDDREFGAERSLIHYVDQSDFTRHLRLNIDAANASDDQWFEDFGQGPENTSVLYLNRSASLTYLDDHWLGILHAQNFQTIARAPGDVTDPLSDVGIPPEDRPYTLLPQLAIRGMFPDQPYGLTMGADLELVNFDHNVDGLNTGWRADFAPEIRMPLRGAGIYLEPAASWRYTSYKLDDPVPGGDDNPSRSAPIFSVDGGVAFERASGSRQQRLITFEPRFMYLYVPLRDQGTLPVFDTGTPDLNLVQLFRTNRFVGADRLGDANQLAFGVTSRLLDADTGRQFISATVGQAYYFDPPRVTLPGEVPNDTESSDIVAELDLRAFSDWNVSAGLQWDPGETRSEKGDVQLQYRPDYERVVNLGYRFRRADLQQPSDSLAFRRDDLEQVDGSVAWPVSREWSVYARMVYSLEDQKTLDQFAGLEYRSCCWRLRVVGRRYVSDRTGDLDTSVLLQLELNGLSNVGVGADAFLERSIRGYSTSPPDSDR